MWKQISKINFYRYFNFVIDYSSLYPELVYHSDWKEVYEYYIYLDFVNELEAVDIPIFRRVEYSNGRFTYFVSLPFVKWFKLYIN